jgi:hypothetical protein
MGKKKGKFSVDTRTTKGLDEDRGDAWWQEERGPRYGVSRKARAKKKRYERNRDLRNDENIDSSY